MTSTKAAGSAYIRLFTLALICSQFVFGQDQKKCQSLSRENQDWKTNIDWCIGNSDAGGAVNCGVDYPYPACVVSGGRKVPDGESNSIGKGQRL